MFYLLNIKWAAIIISFFLVPLTLSAQIAGDTCYQSFFKTFSNPSGDLEIKDICRTSDGGYALAGRRGYLTNPVVIKLNKRAEIEWSQYLPDPTWAYKVLQATDGNIIVAAFSPYACQLLKFTNSGTLLWSKKIDDTDGYGVKVHDIQQASNGDMLILFNTEFGFPPIDNFIIRIDANANIIWKKRVRNEQGIVVIKSFLLDNQDIYLAADSYPGALRNGIDLGKLNAVTGEFVWTKRFQSDIPYLFDPHLAMINDTLCISSTAKAPGPINDTLRLAILTVNPQNGDAINGFVFRNPVLSYNVGYYAIYDRGPFHFNRTGDGQLFFSQQVYDGADTVVNATKFTTNGMVIWSKSYKNLRKHDVWGVKSDGDAMLLCGRRYVTYPNTTDAGFIMKINRDGNISNIPLPATADCFNEPTVPDVQPLLLYETPFKLLTTTENTAALLITDYNAATGIASFVENLSCSVETITCGLLSLSAPDSICIGQNNNSVTYIAHRPAGCNNVVNWLYDPSMATQIQSTDTSIILSLLNTGSLIVKARMLNSCGENLISDTIYIFRNASSADIGPDLQVCFPATIRLNAQPGFSNYNWNTGSTDSVLNVTAPGIYYVQVKDFCGNIFTDTVKIMNDVPPPVSLGIDRIKCNSDTIHLLATPGFSNYQWSPPYNLILISPREVTVNPLVDTAYYIEAIAGNGCIVKDTVKVSVRESAPINLGADKNLCEGDSIQLNAGAGFSQYIWNTGAVSSSISAAAIGTYSVQAIAGNDCQSTDTINILAIDPSPSAFLPADSSLCINTTIILSADRSFSSYNWSTGANSSFIIAQQPGNYWLTVKDNKGCTGTDSIRISPKECIQGFFMPSAFTPNGDGKNDLLKPTLYGTASIFELTIYNRYSQPVFTTKDPSKGWNGKLNGIDQPTGSYVWVCRFRLENEPLKLEKGNCILVR